jgi:hypothetical protein
MAGFVIQQCGLDWMTIKISSSIFYLSKVLLDPLLAEWLLFDQFRGLGISANLASLRMPQNQEDATLDSWIKPTDRSYILLESGKSVIHVTAARVLRFESMRLQYRHHLLSSYEEKV